MTSNGRSKAALSGALMVCGTSSDAGKSQFVVGLCRLLSRRGIKVAPFKGQNMALNSFVTVSGHEIGRAQASQAQAAGVEPEVAMNPVLLKPTGDHTSQVVVMGRPWAELDSRSFQAAKKELRPVVLGALEELRSRFDVVICEGAGSPAEINLMENDLVNLGLAKEAGIPAILIGDIERGGVFASLYGTLKLLPPELSELVGGFVINKFRGDASLLDSGISQIEKLCDMASLGVIPYTTGLDLDAEDSLALERPWRTRAPGETVTRLGEDEQACDLEVVVIRFPRIANFTDWDPLRLESAVTLRYVSNGSEIGSPDLVILPGSKQTVGDLAWLVETGMVSAISKARQRGATVLGVCGGYQMLGHSIVDGVESETDLVQGLSWLDASTVFGSEKVVAQRRGSWQGIRAVGYQIHNGRVTAGSASLPWLILHIESHDETGACMQEGTEAEGVVNAQGDCFGTTLHGLFEQDDFRWQFLSHVAKRRGKAFSPTGVQFFKAREEQHDLLAGLVETHIAMPILEKLITKVVS